MSAVVYRAFDDNDRLLYVGCTVDLPPRLRYHEENAPWWPFHSRIETVEYADRDTAAAAEAEAIATEHPRWNVRGRSPHHPDGPLSSRFHASHLRNEVEIWQAWKKANRLRLQANEAERYATERLKAHHASVLIGELADTA